MNENKFIDDFITVGELREMPSSLRDDDMITVTMGNAHPNQKISHVEDGTCCGFYELRIS